MSYVKVECGKLVKYCEITMDKIFKSQRKLLFEFAKSEYNRRVKVYNSWYNKYYRKFFNQEYPDEEKIREYYSHADFIYCNAAKLDLCTSFLAMARDSSNGYIYISREDYEELV